MKYYQQPFFHPDSTRLQKVIAAGTFTFKAVVCCVIPYSAAATAKSAEDALGAYQRHAVNLDWLSSEIENQDPRSPIYRLIAASRRQRAALAHALSYEFKSSGWYKRSAKRYYGNFAIMFLGSAYLFRSKSLFISLLLLIGKYSSQF